MPQQPDTKGQEFYYLDEKGKKCDAELHAHILRPVEGIIDEKILAKIRERKQKKPKK